MKSFFWKSRGSVLIMVLWALTLLAMFAVQIASMTQDKISFLARAQRNSTLRSAAKAGIFKALAVIKNEPFKNPQGNPLQRSLSLFSNPGSFKDLLLGVAETSVFYTVDDSQRNYGVTDEKCRLNLNFAKRENIQQLFMAIGVVNEEQADKIATEIYDWRVHGDSELKGFSSDDSYENLQYPYPQKKGAFESLSELKLVAGISEKVYDSMINYVTIYGANEYNVNTVLWQVLVALGFTEEQAKAGEAIRLGPDGLNGTTDDVFFVSGGDLVDKINNVLDLSPEEKAELNNVAAGIAFTTQSNIFRIQSHAKLIARRENKSITCVFDSNNDKIIYWHER
ncbi:MAG: general secretion pathway protein GspK [Candidatus Omnitrophica bacterium]|nr:general secretion pathway protein GspK [Candidatus Omnitrophota bacterium]